MFVGEGPESGEEEEGVFQDQAKGALLRQSWVRGVEGRDAKEQRSRSAPLGMVCQESRTWPCPLPRTGLFSERRKP